MLGNETSPRAEEHQVLWFHFIVGRTIVTGALLLVLVAIHGIVPSPSALPLHLLALTQFGVNGIYLYLWRKRELLFLGYLVFALEILLLSALIFMLGDDGSYFLLAYLWPIMMGGWLIGPQAVLPLTLLAAVAYTTLIVLQQLGIQPMQPAWAPGQASMGALLGLVYLISVAGVVWICYSEASRQRGLLRRRHEALRRANADLRALLQAREELARPDGEHDLLEIALEQLRALAGQVSAGIYLREGDRWALRAETDLGESGSALAEATLRTAQDWGLWERFLTGDGRAERGVASSRGPSDVYLVPLSSPHALEGCLALVMPSGQDLTLRQRNMIAFLARSLAATLEGRRLLDDLRRERDLVAGVLDNLDEGVLVADGSGTIRLVNPAARDLVGVDAGQPVPEQFISRGEPAAPLRWGERFLRVREAPLGDAGDRCDDVVYVVRDVTTDLEAQQRQSDFVAYVAHELRTPLTTMRTLTGLLAQEDIAAEKRDEYLHVIANQIERQTKLVRGLLDLSRLEAGHYDLPKDLVDVRGVVREAVTVCQPLAIAKGQKIQVDLPGDGLLIESNADGLQQVLINLLSNAIKFTRDGGELGIACAGAAGRCRIRVWDRGIGMTPEEQRTLFIKYATRRSQNGQEGIGLGLVISKMILDQLGAELQVHSRPGEGSVFTVSLPLANVVLGTAPDG